MTTNSILIPGGLGYVGSHTILDIFLHTDFHIVIVDDMSNCTYSVLDRMKTILINNSRTK
jgi:UDP-glucose 4-epimerase